MFFLFSFLDGFVKRKRYTKKFEMETNLVLWNFKNHIKLLLLLTAITVNSKLNKVWGNPNSTHLIILTETFLKVLVYENHPFFLLVGAESKNNIIGWFIFI